MIDCKNITELVDKIKWRGYKRIRQLNIINCATVRGSGAQKYYHKKRPSMGRFYLTKRRKNAQLIQSKVPQRT